MMSVSSSESALATAGYGGCNHPKVKINSDIPLFSVVKNKYDYRIGNFQPLDFNSDFGQEIIKGFNSFTGEAREVIIQQLEGLRAECKTKGVKLLLGTPFNPFKNRLRMGVSGSDEQLLVFISEDEIKKQMEEPEYFIQIMKDGSYTLKTKLRKELIGDDVGRYAAYVLMHEFSHARASLHFSNLNSSRPEKFDDFVEIYDIASTELKKAFEILFNKYIPSDDIRNTIGFVTGENALTQRIPGEFELLNALHPGITRVYMGSKLDFSDDTLLDAFRTLISKMPNDMNFNIGAPTLIDDGNIDIIELETKIKDNFRNILGKEPSDETIDKAVPSVKDFVQAKWNQFKKVETLKNKKGLIKIDNSVIKTRYDSILKELELFLLNMNEKKGNFIKP